MKQTHCPMHIWIHGEFDKTTLIKATFVSACLNWRYVWQNYSVSLWFWQKSGCQHNYSVILISSNSLGFQIYIEIFD